MSGVSPVMKPESLCQPIQPSSETSAAAPFTGASSAEALADACSSGLGREVVQEPPLALVRLTQSLPQVRGVGLNLTKRRLLECA